MRLSTVKLHGFGQFHGGLDVAFDSPALNVVVGRNEAGKSTLLNAVCGILFGFRDLNTARKYEPWGPHDAYAGEIEFVDDAGRRIRASRDFRAGTATLVELARDGARTLFSGSADPRGASAEDALYFETLGGLTGFQDESVFRNTVFVGQMSMKAEVSEQIRRLMSGSSDVDYKGALHELHGRHSELTGENPWRRGAPARRKALEQSRDELGRAERELSRCRADMARAAALEDEIGELARRAADHDSALAAMKSVAAGVERMFGLLERREGVEARLDEARRRSEAFERHRERLKAVEDRVRREFAPYRGVGAGFPDQVAAWGAERVERAREDEALAAERARLDALKPTPNTGLGGALGVALLAAPAAAGFLTPLGPIPGMIAGAVLGALGFTVGRGLGTGYRAQRQELESKVRDLERSIAGRARRIEEIEAAVGKLLVGREADEVSAEHRTYSGLMEEGRKLSAAMRALGAGDEIERSLREAERESARLEAAVAEAKAQAAYLADASDRTKLGVDLVRLRGDVAEREKAREADRRRAEEARVEAAGLNAQAGPELATLADAAAETRAKVADMDLEKDALKEAIDVLDACIKDFQESDVFRLADEMSKTFAKITGDKYDRVHLGPSLEPLVSSGGRVGIRPENLSQGAQDQLYFALRVSVVRHLSQRAKPPIFLDDPFVNFDAERLAVTRDVLRGLGDHQTILVTCDRSYEDWSDAVVDLDKIRAARN